MISAAADRRNQGEVQGAMSSLQGLMAIVAPLATGWLFERTTRPGGTLHFPGSPFLLAALICLAGLVVVLMVRAPQSADAESAHGPATGQADRVT